MPHRNTTSADHPGHLALALLAMSLLLMAAPAAAATFTVDDIDDAVDVNPGDGLCATMSLTCTLRAAVQEANALPGLDQIDFSQEEEFNGALTLSVAGASEDLAATGDLDVLDDLSIGGLRRGSFGSSIDAAGIDRVFDVHAGTLTVDTMLLRNGAAPPGEDGGGIRNQAEFVGLAVQVWQSSAADGAGIANSGDAVCDACRFALNTASGDGGGIANTGIFDLGYHIYGPGVVENTALRGAGIYNAGTLTMLRASVSSNHATGGAAGGVLNDAGASLQAANLEISDNTATAGGAGIENLGTASLRHVTVAGHGTGVRNDDGAGASTSIESTLLGDACAGTITSTGYNLTASCALVGDATGNQIGVDPDLIAPGPCNNIGNPLPCPFFYRPRPSSPAVDAGKPGGCIKFDGTPLVADPRGVLRPTGAACDVGAIEMVPACVGPGRAIEKAKLSISGLQRPSGQQTVKFSGRIRYLPGSDFPRPSQFGAQISLTDMGNSATLLERSQTLDNPVQIFGRFPDTCWEWKGSITRFKYREKAHGCDVPTPSGAAIKSLIVSDQREQSDQVDVRFKATGASVPTLQGALRVTYTFGKYAHQSHNNCASLDINPGSCSLSGNGGTLRCQVP